MAGYSGTPLPKKLGFRPGFVVLFDQPPANWEVTLGPLPDDCRQAEADDTIDLAILFALDSEALAQRFDSTAARISTAGMIWIAWPKKASGYQTDLDGNRVRQIGLDAELVDVKVCAIDDFWSGLKFVKRVDDR